MPRDVVHRYHNRVVNVDGALEGMTGNRNMPVVTAVTACGSTERHGTVPIGIGAAAYDDNKERETLLSPNYLRRYVDLDEKPIS